MVGVLLRALSGAASLAALNLGSVAFAANCSVPVAGTVERKVVMDTVRAPVTEELNQPVEFVAHKFKVCARHGESFAFLDAALQAPGGSQVDWSITPYAQADCSRLVIALLHRQAGKPWTVVELDICPTDVPWEVWPEQYHAPAELFR